MIQNLGNTYLTFSHRVIVINPISHIVIVINPISHTNKGPEQEEGNGQTISIPLQGEGKKECTHSNNPRPAKRNATTNKQLAFPWP